MPEFISDKSLRVGYRIVIFILSLISISLVWPTFTFTPISPKSIFFLTVVSPSSGQIKFKSTFSPTDFPLILKKKYSTSNIGRV